MLQSILDVEKTVLFCVKVASLANARKGGCVVFQVGESNEFNKKILVNWFKKQNYNHLFLVILSIDFFLYRW